MKSKILIADDDSDLVEVLSERLQAEGFETAGAYEGVEVIEKALAFRPHLILLDWKMPAGKGSAVLEMLAERVELKSIPVIILSGIDEPGMRQIATSMGAKDFIRKPYDEKALLKSIRQALNP